MTQTEAVGVDPGKGRCEDHVLVREADGSNGVRDPFCESHQQRESGRNISSFLCWRTGLTRFSLTIICLA